MLSRIRVLDVALLATFAIVGRGPALRAQQTDVVRGRVTGSDSLPMQGVNVKATSYQGSVEKTATTDKAGRFTIVFINGEGDYWVDFTKIGYPPRRMEVRRIGDEEVLIANARMSTGAARLAGVEVTAERNRALPGRTANGADVGGGDRSLNTGNTPADQAGNLAAMAATVAGFQIIPGLDGAADMFSMLGLSGDQNNTTFDGLGSGISALPPDILATTSIRPYPFDPSIGGFSGAQIAVQTIPGSNFSRRSLTTVNITPPFEWADRTALAQGQKYTNVRLGGNAAGPLSPNRAFYNVAYNAGRQFSDLQTLLNTSPLGLTAAGVSPDSAARLVAILQRQRVPVDFPATAGAEAKDVAQLAANFDLMPSGSGGGHSFTIGGAGNYQRTQPVSRGGLLLTTPAHAGETSLWGASATLVHSNYFWFGVLSKATLGFSASRTSTSPYEELPEGIVRVQSVFSDGTSSVKPLSFGGGSSASSLGNQALQLSNQLSWYNSDNTHTLKITSGVIRDAFETDQSASLLGTFNYNSLSDLDVGRPASFTRTLGKNLRDGAQVTSWASLSDYWRPVPSLQVQYGVRADGNRFLTRPSFNAGVDSAFGLRNDATPSRVYFSPRVGILWYYGKPLQVAYAPGSARPPRAVIHAGVGVFQNMAPAQLVGPAISATGLSNSTQSITCVGAATPLPDWTAYSESTGAIPTRCADGSDGTIFATAAPNVSLFAPAFRQARSVRAAADWSGPVLGNRFVAGLQAIVSTGEKQQNVIDANLNPAQRFTLATEGGRPVFVDPAAIVPSTGAVATLASRVSTRYQHVWEARSDLASRAKQVSVNLKPVTANAMLRWDLTYTLLDVRESFSGFSSTSGNPFGVQWGRGLQPGRHTVTLAWNDFPIFDVVYLSAGFRFMSGMRFTPMIAGDVNGDGSANDRAFIPNPATTSDTALASGMRALLAGATPEARSCVERQLNTLATRGSCVAPWTANAGLIVKFNPQKIGLPKRATVTLTLQNAFALADLALHRPDDRRGWGQNIPPDQNLLFVRGFDPTARQYRYDVNQRFGSTRPQQSATYALPFVSLGVSVDIGVPRERQMLTQRLDAGRAFAGSKASASALASFGTASIPNPMFLILQQADSLQLTRRQADSLATLSRLFAQFADSVWTPTGRYLASLTERYNTSEAYERYTSARVATVDYLLTLVPDAKQLLTPAQRRSLPRQVANFLDERVLKFLRTSTVGDGSAAVIR